MFVAVFGLGAFQKSGLQELKKLNYKIIGFDENKKPVNKNLVDNFFCIPFKNKNKILNICKKYNVISLFAFSTDAPLNIISYINKKLKLSGYKERDVILIKNKNNFRKFLKEKLKVNTPKFLFLKKLKIESIKKNMVFPIVCKPDVGSGSRGVFFCKNINLLNDLFEKNKEFYKKKNIMIEQFIPGTEYAVDGWIYKKNFIFCCLSKKKRTKPPYLLDENLVINYQNNLIKLKIKKLMERIIFFSKIDNVPIHLEFIYKSNKVFLIDIAIRGAGFGVYSNILSIIMNQSTDLILINLLQNKKIIFNAPNKKSFYLSFFKSSINGNFKKIINLNFLKKSNSFFELNLYKKINTKVSPLENGADRIGHFLLMNSPKKLSKDIKFLAQTVKADVQ